MPMTTLGPGGPAVSRIGLGLAALGRPAYITSGRAEDLPDRSVDALRERSFAVLDAAYAAGVRYFDAARSYGRAEEFLGGWLDDRGHPDAVCGSKWGYRYTGDWRLDAAKHEVKEHSLAMFTAQLAETRALLGPRLALYQVHSLTEDSPLLGDAALLDALGALRDTGVRVGLSTSGPAQAVDAAPGAGRAGRRPAGVQCRPGDLEPAGDLGRGGRRGGGRGGLGDPGQGRHGQRAAGPRHRARRAARGAGPGRGVRPAPAPTRWPSPPRWPSRGPRSCCPAWSPWPSWRATWPRWPCPARWWPA